METKNYFSTDAAGNIIPSATCYLYLPGTTTLASGITNINGAPLTNPFTAAPSGLVQFKAPDGEYDLRVVGGGREFSIRIQCFDGVAFLTTIAALLEGYTTVAQLADSDGAAFVGYSQAETYAPGTVGARLKRDINVMDAPYNAPLNGTDDDSSAIQAAINAAPAGSRIIIPPTPTGGIATGLVVNKVVHLVFKEGGSLKHKAGSTVPMITYLGVPGFKMRGLKADGNKTNQTVQTNVVEIKNCANFKLFDVDVDNASYCGLRIETNSDAHPTRSYLHRVSATRSGYSGIQMYAASRLTLKDCNASDNAGFGAFYDSATAEAGSDIIIDGGNYDYNGYAGINFPYFDYVGLLGKCGKAMIRGATANNNGTNGIAIQGKDKTVMGGETQNNVITGVLVNGKQCSVNGVQTKYNGSVGIDWGDCESITCTGNSAIGNGDMGIEVNSCSGGCVTGNTVLGNNINVNTWKAGISLHLGSGGYPFTGPTQNITVTGNFVGPGPNQDYGIYLSADTSGCFVGDNTTTGSGAVQDIRCVSAFNVIKPGASRASHMGALSQITIPSATSITIPDSQEEVFITGTVSIATITGGNLSAGREINLIFNTSGGLVLNTGNILTAFTAKNWRPVRLTYVKSLEKWAVMDTTTF